ncbi:outer membrane beta-barrel protein [Dyadobacter sp. NIV53]|uniref:outer membrane beta-barrel protein n=1 Tax=Dyadobacter sp. NIV53 TaxID=2861765 RepID=UPI001E6441E3|nr:outer membrane beta-barrel protein [Dyadobacter sp. NIV53]
MMDPSEINNFENQWKKAFDEASETPPPSVWKGIEARLDHDENDRIIPLWWRNPKIWYAAASIAALLLVGGGIWYNNRLDDRNLNLAQNRFQTETRPGKAPANDSEKVVAQENEAGKKVDEEVLEETLIASSPNKSELNKSENGKTRSTVVGNENVTEKADKEFANSTKSGNVNSGKTKANSAKEPQYAINKIQKNQQVSDKNDAVDKVSSGLPADVVSDKIATVAIQPDLKEKTVVTESKPVLAELLTPLPYSDLEVFMQKRYVFFKPESIKEEKLSEPKKSGEYWAGISMMPASFNPDVKIKSAPTAFASQLNSRQKSLTGTNEAGTSYALQTQGGVRLSKHWSMEMGVSYLKGNAKYEGGGYVLSAYANTSSNVLQSALNGLSANPSADKSGDYLNNGALYIDVNKKVSNDYQYLQLPLQAGFTLNPDKKLSYSVLGGMMANFFLSNELESASGEIITTKASDDVYRSMNWAATTGLRFNYKLSTKWKASLTGSYQKAISSGFKANQSLESHPYLYGVSWGVRYSF